MKTKPVAQLKKEMDSAELQAKVEADREKRANAMKEYLEAGLKKFNCKIEPVITITAQGNRAMIDIQPL